MPILRNYQIDIINKGIDILEKYKILYLAMQTRTGKTLTALHVANEYNAENVLFVTKLKAIESIQSDYDSDQFCYNIKILNFESVHKLKNEYDFIIIDEAHSLGQYPIPSERVKKLKGFCLNKPIIFLSATPAPESWSQLYHQFFMSSFSPFINNANFYKWSKDFVTMKIKYVYNREVNDYSDANQKIIWSKIGHLFITKTQESAGFKIEVTEKILKVEMPSALKNIIKKIIDENVFVDEDYSILADTAVKVLQKVHQLSSGTVIDDFGYKIVSTFKADYLKKWGEGKKLAIFYKFKSEFEMLKVVFDNWTDNAFEFQSTNKIFLGQFQSAREGIRLDKAEAIVFLNIDFSYLSYEQAKNRIASFERKESAILYWLFSDCGIEKKIHNAVMNKQDYTLNIYKDERIKIRAELEQKSNNERMVTSENNPVQLKWIS